ncbi:MAG TPA: DEAD/DEAH box helicase family protein, partial [Bacteroidia bacterium]|nr:DEAD/DEAH box helicase family protein [Bacteroidia bacterium]
MELKPYQQKVLNELDEYLGYVRTEGRYDKAFDKYWEDKLGPYNPLEGKGMEPYKNDVPRAPHVCIKVPTAGGKTFIASNAIEIIYRYYREEISKTVVWLVPSVTILEQTIGNLSDPTHPYRQRINTHFNSRVEVYRKDDLLNGTGFNATSVQEQLSILVLSFDSLRSKKKEDRKFYQENGQLASFSGMNEDLSHVLEGTDETALINVIRKLKPVVIVDEAHGAVSDLSVEMLRNLNPSFVLDLTATPRETSNIISFVNAMELKKENMVKLPVIVYNHKDRNGVIESAINLQRKLEKAAKEEELNGGRYIRPIVLFQAQSKTAEDNTTFEKIKQILLALKIPEAEIRIKTADINEIKDVDLMSPECPVRYIITVNALKEGWDCPFAYILASLADKSSAIDVEQILGRVLRQPYVKQHKFDLLNCSFVLTASAKFMDTLENIVRGLNKAGFSKHDYKIAADETASTETKQGTSPAIQLTTGTEAPLEDIGEEVKPEQISVAIDESTPATEATRAIEEQATQANREMIDMLEKRGNDVLLTVAVEIQNKVKTYAMKELFAEKAKAIQLPMFFMKVPAGGFLLDDEYVPFDKDSLLRDFKLSQQDSTIDFDSAEANLYKVDLEKTKGDDSTPTFSQLEDSVKKP